MTITLYDSVTITEIPRDAEAVAGYVNGKWPTYWTLVTDFPQARKLSIAVDAFHDADCLDVEKGDATADQAPAWVKKQLARGVRLPVVYSSVAEASTLISALAKHGVRRSQYRLWTAHYTYGAHLCGPECGFGFRGRADATQYTDKALGRNLDASLCSPSFFQIPVKPVKARLRARILGWHKHGVPWKRIKATRVWRLYRSLRGR